ncbi:MAG: autotransporter outer membrane beta-barrel domain-containing protein [Synergistaceae bacterium]|jgi:hypothetical protein|nr:autotransporter outer membrane beta-barrel domain-containing protein [Synergistaceae bacterium]
MKQQYFSREKTPFPTTAVAFKEARLSYGGEKTFPPFSLPRLCFSLLLCAVCFAFFPPPGAEAAIGTLKELQDALASPAAGTTLTLDGTITFGSGEIALDIKAPGLTLQGGTSVWTNADGMKSGIADLTGALAPGALENLATQAGTLASTFISGAALSGMTSIVGDGATRNAGDDIFLNQRKWLNIPAEGAQSPYNGLNLTNLNFGSVNVEYDLGSTPKKGYVDGLIGGANDITTDTSLGDITGSAFTDITVTVRGQRSDQYLAGGGVVGVRSTGEKPAAHTDSANAEIGSVSGNLFKNISVSTTGPADNSAYLEGGGLIGADAASSPDDKTGIAKIKGLTNNLFTGVTVQTDDILLGGGLVGVNNNSKHLATSSENLATSDTWAILEEASGNIFGNGSAGDIKVTAGYSIRGGGVIGVNGLAAAGAELTRLQDNIFNGIAVTAGSYIKGGGLVGLQTSYTDTANAMDSDKFGIWDWTNPNNPTHVGTGNPDVDSVNAYLLTNRLTHMSDASGNVFLNSSVNAATYLYGGGMIGLHAFQSTAAIETLNDNLFKNLTVTVGDEMKGGGIAGISSAKVGILTEAKGNYFDSLTVKVGGKLKGGGVIGIQLDDNDPDQSGGYSIGGNIVDNSFTNLNVKAGSIQGGGVVGAQSSTSITGFGGNFDVREDGISGNRLSNITVETDSYIAGGGVFGVYSDGGSASMLNVNNNVLVDTTVKTGGYIQGGGLIGVRTDGVGTIQHLDHNYIIGTEVTAGTYIDGGGIIGATSASPTGASTQAIGIGTIENTILSDNNITAQNGQIGGGLIYSYGAVGGMTIKNSFFGGNTFASNYTGAGYADQGAAKVYGTVTIDTGYANTASNAPYTLTITATDGYYTYFGDNKITENGQERYSSLYFGTVDGVTTDDSGTIHVVHDAADADARLEIRSEPGGMVMLFDPIVVNQDNGKTFDMEVRPVSDASGALSGYFLWADKNKFTVGAPGRVDLRNGTYTQIFDGMELDAPQHTFTLEEGAQLTVMGHNKMNLTQANLKGELIFNLEGTTMNDPDTALLKISNPDGNPNVDVTGSRVRLTPFAPGLTPKPGDRFYLIGTAGPDHISGTPSNQAASSYARGGYTTGYNFIIDTSVPTGPDGAEEITNQYLVARLPDVAIPDVPDPNNPTPTPLTPVTPSNPTPSTPDFPDPKPGPTPAPTPVTPANNPVDPTPSPEPTPYIPAYEGSALTNGRLAGLAFIGQRGGWLADHSYESASIVLSNDILSDDPYGRASAPFAGIDGAWLRVDNKHSHVDIDASNIIVGFATKARKQGKDGKPDVSTLWGAFIDIGNADYDTWDSYSHLSQVSIDDIHGSGTLRSRGLGLMVRREWADGFRLEGSFRGGKLKNEFTAHDYLDANGVPASYKTNTPYYGAHLGVGRTWQLNDPRDRLDLLFRYYWSRQGGETVTFADGEWVDFDRDDSHRVRLGARFTRMRNSRQTWYLGAALEHEFGGTIHARNNKNQSLPAADLEGTTGIGEIGLILRPDQKHDFSLEAGLQGYFGKIEGFSAGIRFEWEF